MCSQFSRGGLVWTLSRRIVMRMMTLIVGTAVLSPLGAPEAAVAGNREDCQEWCAARPGECDRCSELAGCGTGYRRIQSFRGRGRNWYACAETSRTEGSEANLADCTEWCRAHSECASCKKELNCGRGMSRLRTFNDHRPGDNWYACANTRSRAENSAANLADCTEWCRAHAECASCKREYNCGRGMSRLRTFNDHRPGDNWYACENN
jgi:hypothetical protein